MKLPFQKKQPQPAPSMPPEVQEYYQAERRERKGIAWLLAIGTLLITLAIIVGLFFGGRWVYRKLTLHKNTTTTTTSQTNTTKKPSSTTSNGTSQGTTNSSNSSSNGSTAKPTTPPSSTPQGTTNSGSNTSGKSSGGVVSPTAATTNIPNTGPGDTVAIFFGVSAFGYLAHRLIFSKKQ